MGEVLTAQAKHTGGMEFDVTTSSGHTVILDAADEAGGKDIGPRPMEMLLVGLAGCTGMDVISILRKMRQDVTAYEVRVRGERAEEHPKIYVDITVEHVVTGHNLNPDMVARAVELSETRYCGAGNMLGKVARLTHTHTIVEAPTVAEESPTR
jgi:putative redox protein